jgi:hypothetical protein
MCSTVLTKWTIYLWVIYSKDLLVVDHGDVLMSLIDLDLKCCLYVLCNSRQLLMLLKEVRRDLYCKVMKSNLILVVERLLL